MAAMAERHRAADGVAAPPRRTTAERIGLETVAAVMDVFYDRIQQHPTLAASFRVVGDWEAHKAKLAHFWWVGLGGRSYASYRYEVVPRHAAVGVTPALVDDWLALFETTVREYVPAESADFWLFRARRMGDSLRLVDEHYRRKAARSAA